MEYVRSALVWSFLALPILAGQGSSKEQYSEGSEFSWIDQSKNANDAPAFVHADYSQEDLVRARMAWIHHENEINRVKDAALHVMPIRTLEMLDASFIPILVVSINAHNKTITTSLDMAKSVTVSYADFDKLLRDKTISDLANERFQVAQKEPKKSIILD